ncbi:uncharacterized protein LOC113793624 [Dermatophagoides pteronyssinus]|uniref:Uncharacterized protein n=2 Tax=Dermatophagoides pteronyssinus TaxID=6956 RepID=A0ABQ8IYR0_DERPT|nr:uncharacterized protein LOC113793624 [Dermatophagoides pteronyssinus]KAH9415449.1 hypothetical protein DERP_010305 [Dermatophagoides pteronyssinus]
MINHHYCSTLRLSSFMMITIFLSSSLLLITMILITNIDNVDGQFFTKTSKSIPRMGRKVDNSLIMESEDLPISDRINDYDRIPSTFWNHQQQQPNNQTNLLHRLFVQIARLFRQSPQAY